MLSVILLMATFLHHPASLVQKVYDVGGINLVTNVEMESNFKPTVVRNEGHGWNSYGLGQICNHYHSQYRNNLQKHIEESNRILLDGMRVAKGNFAVAVAHYNGGTHPTAYSFRWGKKVEKKKMQILYYIAWRNMRELGIAGAV
jgi:hypothetical protein